MTENDVYNYLVDNTELSDEKARDLSAKIFLRLSYSSMYEQIDMLLEQLNTPDLPMNGYIQAWLADQCDDYPDKFPSDFDFDSAVDQLNEWFDAQLINDHLDDLLRKLLQEIALYGMTSTDYHFTR